MSNLEVSFSEQGPNSVTSVRENSNQNQCNSSKDSCKIKIEDMAEPKIVKEKPMILSFKR